MSARSAAWLAWSVCAFSVALTLLYALLDLLTPPIPMREFPHWLLGYPVFYTIGLLLYPTVGALVASRRPHNPIGWIFCGIGFLNAAQSFAVSYGDYSLVVRHGALVGVKIMAWLSSWIGSDAIGLIGVALLFLLFPNGRLLSSLWRPVMWVALGAGTTLFVVDAFIPGPLYTFPSITNPVGIGGTVGDILGMLDTIGIVVLLIALLASAGSLILRLLRARGIERQQLKWFVYAATLVTIGAVVAEAGANVFASELINVIGYWEGQLAFAALPVFTGIAILRYRLYDIDRIINRTLVYGSLTATLVAAYFAGVTATQAVFQTLTGKEQLPQLVVVASTLMIAALFTPLRRRIQALIDRRFYRRKYDAAKTLEAFSTKLRNETDLDALSDDLLSVVRETMQPAHVSLWLRPAGGPKAKSSQAIADSVGPITMPPEKEHQRGEGTLGGATRRTRVNRRGLWAACVVLILLLGGVGALLTTVGTVGAGCAKDKDTARAKCCSEATLNGRYLLAFDGFIVEGDEKVPSAVANFEVFDGNGNAKGVSSFSVNGKITRKEPFSATYTVKANCTGTTTVDANVVTHYDFFTAPDGRMITFVQTDPGVVAAGSQLRGSAKRVGE